MFCLLLGCHIVDVGSSYGNTKTITLDKELICPKLVDETNWVGEGNFSDTFSVLQRGKKLTVQRTGAPGRWEIDLKFYCCVQGKYCDRYNKYMLPLIQF